MWLMFIINPKTGGKPEVPEPAPDSGNGLLPWIIVFGLLFVYKLTTLAFIKLNVKKKLLTSRYYTYDLADLIAVQRKSKFGYTTWKLIFSKHIGQKVAVETRTVKLFKAINDRNRFVLEFFDLLKSYDLIRDDIVIPE